MGILDNQCPVYNTILEAQGRGALKETKGAKHLNGRAEFTCTNSQTAIWSRHVGVPLWGTNMLVYHRGTPTWQPENSVNVRNLLWLSKRRIICAEQKGI